MWTFLCRMRCQTQTFVKLQWSCNKKLKSKLAFQLTYTCQACPRSNGFLPEISFFFYRTSKLLSRVVYKRDFFNPKILTKIYSSSTSCLQIILHCPFSSMDYETTFVLQRHYFSPWAKKKSGKEEKMNILMVMFDFSQLTLTN